MSDKKVISLQAVKQEAEAERKQLEHKALVMGLHELLEHIEEGRVAGVAFAVEYLDGNLGNYHFTSNSHPAQLHLAVSLLLQKVQYEILWEAEGDDDEDY